MSEVMYKRGNHSWIPLEIEMYPDGMPLVTKEIYEDVTEVLLRPFSLHTFTSALFWIHSLYLRGNPEITLKLPLVPGSRQDRLNPSGDKLFTLKSVADMLNEFKWKYGVVVHDPHSDVTPALIDHCITVTALEIIQANSFHMGDYDGVIAPDAGAAKRAGLVATWMGVPLIQAWKKRDIRTGKISGFGIEPILSGRYLIVDDICDGGGTFIGLYDQINSSLSRFDLDLYVTHGIFSQGTAELKKWFSNIYTTDSTLYNKEGCTVFSI